VSAAASNLILQNPSLNQQFEYFLQYPNDIINIPSATDLAKSNQALWNIANYAASQSGVLQRRLGETLQDVSNVANAASQISNLLTAGSAVKSLLSVADTAFTQAASLKPYQLLAVILDIKDIGEGVGSVNQLSAEIPALKGYESTIVNNVGSNGANGSATQAFLSMLQNQSLSALAQSSDGEFLIVEQKIISLTIRNNPSIVNTSAFQNQEIDVPTSGWFGVETTTKMTVIQAAYAGYITIN
jgi:hypothetical protein